MKRLSVLMVGFVVGVITTCVGAYVVGRTIRTLNEECDVQTEEE